MPAKTKSDQIDAYQKFKENKHHISIWVDGKDFDAWEDMARKEQNREEPVMAKFVKHVVNEYIADKSMSAEMRESQLEATISSFKSEILSKLDEIDSTKKIRVLDSQADLNTATMLVEQIKAQVSRGIEPEMAIIDCEGFKNPAAIFDSLMEYQSQFGEIEWNPDLNAFCLTESEIKNVRGLI